MRITNRKPYRMKWKKCGDFYMLDIRDSGSMWICVAPAGKGATWDWKLIGGSGRSVHESKRKFENAFDASTDALDTIQEIMGDWVSALEGAPKISKTRKP